MNDVRLELVDKFKLLGVEVQDTLKLNLQVKSNGKKANKRIYHVRAGRRAGLPSEVGPTAYLTISPFTLHFNHLLSMFS